MSGSWTLRGCTYGVGDGTPEVDGLDVAAYTQVFSVALVSLCQPTCSLSTCRHPFMEAGPLGVLSGKYKALPPTTPAPVVAIVRNCLQVSPRSHTGEDGHVPHAHASRSCMPCTISLFHACGSITHADTAGRQADGGTAAGVHRGAAEAAAGAAE